MSMVPLFNHRKLKAMKSYDEVIAVQISLIRPIQTPPFGGRKFWQNAGGLHYEVAPAFSILRLG